MPLTLYSYISTDFKPIIKIYKSYAHMNRYPTPEYLQHHIQPGGDNKEVRKTNEMNDLKKREREREKRANEGKY